MLTGSLALHVNNAEWHARELIAREAVNDFRWSDHHLASAREELAAIDPALARRAHTADDVAFICAELKDAKDIAR
jgi:hypothetical protein